jgi:hypothetical protein
LVIGVDDQDISLVRQPAWPLVKPGKADLFTALPFCARGGHAGVAKEVPYRECRTDGLCRYSETLIRYH